MRAVNLPGATYPETSSKSTRSPPDVGTVYLICCHEKMSVIRGVSAIAFSVKLSSPPEPLVLPARDFSSSIEVEFFSKIGDLVPRLNRTIKDSPAEAVLYSEKTNRAVMNATPKAITIPKFFGETLVNSLGRENVKKTHHPHVGVRVVVR